MLCSVRPFRDGGDTCAVDDVIGGASAGNVHERPAESLCQRSDGSCAGETLGGFVDAVAAVQIGEHKHVAVPGDFGIRRFFCGDFRKNGGVELKLAFDCEIGREGFGFRGRFYVFSMIGSCAEPFVEQLIIPTLGSPPTRSLNVLAVVTAISAS